MADALRKLNHQRATYYEAIREQTGRTQGVVTGLVWLGAAAIGFSPHVHKDVLITGGLVGASSYGLSEAQLTKRRIDVWQAGIDALDCARETVIPLEWSEEERSQLRAGLRELSTARARVQSARSNLASYTARKEYEKDRHGQLVQPLLETSSNALAESTKTIQAGYGLLRATRGSELSAMVNRISGKVTEVMGNVALGTDSVRSIIGSLPAYVDIFVPGALVKSPPTTTVPLLKTLGDKSVADTSDIDANINSDAEVLRSELSKMSITQLNANDLINGTDVSTVTATLKQCRMTDVIRALSISPDTVELTAGAVGKRFVNISGGNPRYEVSWIGGSPAGLILSVDRGIVVVNASDKTAAGEAVALISDSSNPSLTKQLTIKIQAP